MDETKKQKPAEEKIKGGEKVNAQELFEDVEKIRKELLENKPDRFEENETNRP